VGSRATSSRLIGKGFPAEADAIHAEVAVTTIVHRARATL